MKKLLHLFLLLALLPNLLNAADSAPATRTSSNYTLPKGGADFERSKAQSEDLFDVTNSHLLLAGIKEGMAVWDIGCGAGFVTKHLAELVGPNGHVYAVDESPDQLKIAASVLPPELSDRVTFIKASVLTDELTQNECFVENSADMAFARMLHMHMSAPQISMTNILRVLKPGGKFVAEEPTNSDSRCSSDQELLNEYTKIMIQVAKAKGQDYDFGNRLAETVALAGFRIVDDRSASRLCTILDLRKHYMRIRHIMVALQAEAPNLITPQHLATWDNWAAITEDNGAQCTLGSIKCITAIKPPLGGESLHGAETQN